MEVKKQMVRSEYDDLCLEMEMIVPECPKGIVQISHGMAEHKERYEKFMEYLAQHGYVAAIHDHRGHGKSVKNEQELGYFYTEDSGAIVEDLHQMTVYLKNQFPELPLFLFSHSMGSLVARNYMKKYDAEVEKVILCGPPTKNSGAGPALLMAKISRAVNGEKHRNHWIHSLAFRGYDKKGEAENSWLSSDRKEVSFYNEDSLCGYIFTNNGFINLFKLMKGAFSKDGWEKKHLSLPLLVIAGADDPVIRSSKKFEQMISFLKEVGYSDISSRLYTGMRHELLNEAGRETVYADILEFLEK